MSAENVLPARDRLTMCSAAGRVSSWATCVTSCLMSGSVLGAGAAEAMEGPVLLHVDVGQAAGAGAAGGGAQQAGAPVPSPAGRRHLLQRLLPHHGPRVARHRRHPPREVHDGVVPNRAWLSCGWYRNRKLMLNV